MKERVRKTISPFLAVLVLLSTISWSVEKHLCMGRVMDIAFFHNAEACDMEKAMASMDETMPEMDCCDDESFTMEGLDDLKLSWDELDVGSQEFLVAFAHSYLELISIPSGGVVAEISYPPPLLVFDLNILHEVFLI